MMIVILHLCPILDIPALKSDQVHPNARGDRQMAEAIHQLLQ
jgi:lysophospholipase L1-like esterase